MSSSGRGLKSAAAGFRFLIETLPQDQRVLLSSCSNKIEFERQVERLNEFENVQRHSQRIDCFIGAVSPFFDVIDMISQVDPIHIATVWGGLRVIIQVCLGFTAPNTRLLCDRYGLLTV
jgi:hypothetical protein